MVRVVEPGDVEVWVASHAAASSAMPDSEATTGGAIVSEKRAGVRTFAGTSTARAVVALTGSVHEVRPSDARVVGVRVEVPATASA